MKRAREKRLAHNEALADSARQVHAAMTLVQELTREGESRPLLYMAHQALGLAHSAMHEELRQRARADG